MFKADVYKERRNRLRKKVSNGIILLPGNDEASMNYPSNTYHYRQDSTFLYYFGLDQAGLAGILDADQDSELLFGNNATMDDIIWMGPQPSMTERGSLVGVEKTRPLDDLSGFLRDALAKKRTIHILPPYRGDHWLSLMKLFNLPLESIKTMISEELIHAVVGMRSIKDGNEIREIEKAVDVAYLMHTTAMKMAKPGMVEREITGVVEGISLSHGGPVSFPVIQSIDGQTLHNHSHANVMKEGRMMVTDAGAETEMHYASDITRTVPVGGIFDQRQKDIYTLVLKANEEVIRNIKPGIPFKDMHLLAAQVIASGLKDLGLMKGDMEEAVSQGAHALFFPHGLGHMMGLDVHDMEGLGEDYVGYDDEIKRSDQFGLAFLRLARRMETGWVLTDEPGIYFIPALIDQWKGEGKFADFINYEKVVTYKDFGGIRIEDDILVTEDGCRVLGKPIPKTVKDIENIMQD
ncbi:MAG: aminopeptidase P family protein [Bacteroidales bacterium]